MGRGLLTRSFKMKRVFLKPYHRTSKSARLVASKLGIKRLKLKNSKYKHRKGDIIINWGSQRLNSEELKARAIFNPPSRVEACSNKEKFFSQFNHRHNLRELVVPNTTDEDVVQEWLNEGRKVVGRKLLSSHSGRGIVILDPEKIPDEGVDIEGISLYTKYIPKKAEYRIHFVRTGFERIESLISQKVLRSGVDKSKVNWHVRNHDGGFIFAQNVGGRPVVDTVPDKVFAVARTAFLHLGLNFGAVDVIYNERKDKAYVLEINTAPGLMGRTVDFYTDALRTAIKNMKADRH